MSGYDLAVIIIYYTHSVTPSRSLISSWNHFFKHKPYYKYTVINFLFRNRVCAGKIRYDEYKNDSSQEITPRGGKVRQDEVPTNSHNYYYVRCASDLPCERRHSFRVSTENFAAVRTSAGAPEKIVIRDVHELRITCVEIML